MRALYPHTHARLSRGMLYAEGKRRRGEARWLEESFDRCPKDRFQCVDGAELRQQIREGSGLDEFEDEIKRLVAQSDPHGDGRISLENFCEAIRERRSAILEKEDKPTAHSRKRSSARKRREERRRIGEIRRNRSLLSPTRTKKNSAGEEEESGDGESVEAPLESEKMKAFKRLLKDPGMRAKIELTFLRSHHIDVKRLFHVLQTHVQAAGKDVDESTVRRFVLSCKTDYLGKITMRSLSRAANSINEVAFHRTRAKMSILSSTTRDEAGYGSSSVRTKPVSLLGENGRPQTASSVESSSNILRLIQDELKFSVGLEQLRKMFVQCDVRRCGAVEIHLLRKALHRMALESGREATELFLQYCDSRGDGEVTYGNFIRALR